MPDTPSTELAPVSSRAALARTPAPQWNEVEVPELTPKPLRPIKRHLIGARWPIAYFSALVLSILETMELAGVEVPLIPQLSETLGIVVLTIACFGLLFFLLLSAFSESIGLRYREYDNKQRYKRISRQEKIHDQLIMQLREKDSRPLYEAIRSAPHAGDRSNLEYIHYAAHVQEHERGSDHGVQVGLLAYDSTLDNEASYSSPWSFTHVQAFDPIDSTTEASEYFSRINEEAERREIETRREAEDRAFEKASREEQIEIEAARRVEDEKMRNIETQGLIQALRSSGKD